MLELKNTERLKLNFHVSSIEEVSIVCDIKWFEKDRICLDFPDEGEKYIKDLPEGKEIEAIVYSNCGIFIFDSIVINSPLEKEFVIELPEEKKQIQRREYIRAPINLNLSLIKGNIKYETQTINIGGGGARFSIQENINVNDLWNFRLTLPDGYLIEGLGKILYTILQGNNKISVIVYNKISDTERNRIIKLCLDQEIKCLSMKRE